MIWDNIVWRYSFPKIVTRGRGLISITGLKIHIPMIPGDKEFRKMLREVLMRDNPYASHRVDSVIKASYPISESWRKDI